MGVSGVGGRVSSTRMYVVMVTLPLLSIISSVVMPVGSAASSLGDTFESPELATGRCCFWGCRASLRFFGGHTTSYRRVVVANVPLYLLVGHILHQRYWLPVALAGVIDTPPPLHHWVGTLPLSCALVLRDAPIAMCVHIPDCTHSRTFTW